MSIEWVEVLNQETGERGRISRGHFENPAIVKPGLLVEVDPDQKPYLPEMFRARTAEPEVANEDPETDEAEEPEDEED